MQLNTISILLPLALAAASTCTSAARAQESQNASAPSPLPSWALGPFVRPRGVNPIISPKPESTFQDPLSAAPVRWEALHTFNPAAVVRNGKVYVLYRAEDDSGDMKIGRHTSRLGLAESEDGLRFTRRATPVFFPANDAQKENEWPGGVEDPRITEAPDGTYVMTYTQWNQQRFRIGIATSRDLVRWTKHGQVFQKSPKYAEMRYKSSGIVCKPSKGRLVAAKIGGRFWMYWGERPIHLASSTDLINWQPVEGQDGKLLTLLGSRPGKFDSDFPEVGPPPVLTDRGIVLIYNGKNAGRTGDPTLGPSAYAAGQALFDARDPSRLLDRLDAPFFKPEMPYEMRGQYQGGTTFTEGLVYFRDKWFLYYGCADSLVAVAVHDKAGRVVPEIIPATLPREAALSADDLKSHPLMAKRALDGQFAAGTALQGVRRIVCLGDSITQGGEGPAGYVGLMRKYLSEVSPGTEVLNAGISGHKSNDMLARFERDVLQKKPDLITISVGVNDVWHGFDAEHPQGGGPRSVALEQYRANVDTMVAQGQASGATVVLLSPTVIYEDLGNAQNAILTSYIAALRGIAHERKCLFVDLLGAFATPIDLHRTTGSTANLLTGDGVHMNEWGNRLMASTILRALTAPAPAGTKLRTAM